MKPKTMLFIGMYPNVVNPYRNVFFQNLIFAIADKGIECVVVSPVPITKYFTKTFKIPKVTHDLTPGGNTVEVHYPRYISVSSKKFGKFNTEVLSEYLFERAALKEIQKINRKFNCVYGHFFLYGGLAAVKAGRRLNIPSFIAFGECDYETQVQQTFGNLQKKHIEGLRGIIAVSSKNAMVLKELGIFNNIKVVIAPNAVDLTLFHKKDKEKCRTKLGLSNDQFIVGFVGGFIERKGDKRLLEAVNQTNDIYVAFAGRGENPPKGKRVLFCQALLHDDVPDFLNALDVFCLPTLSEGSCNAIVEAAACGIPIISSDLPFNNDFLNKNNSIRIDPLSIDEIKNSLESIKKDKNYRKRLAQNVYKDAQCFSIDKRAEKIITFIDELI